MFTVILAWINAKYDYNYELVFFATFLIDLRILSYAYAIYIC